MRFAVHFNEHSHRSVQLCLKSYRMLAVALARNILCFSSNETREKNVDANFRRRIVFLWFIISFMLTIIALPFSTATSPTILKRMRVKYVGVRCTCTSLRFLCIHCHFSSIESFSDGFIWARSFLHMLICSYGMSTWSSNCIKTMKHTSWALFSANNDIYVINFIRLEIVQCRKMLCENLFMYSHCLYLYYMFEMFLNAFQITNKRRIEHSSNEIESKFEFMTMDDGADVKMEPCYDWS